LTHSVDEATAKKIEEEKLAAHLAYCPFCGKGLFWFSLLDIIWSIITLGKKSLLAVLPNKWQAHKGCYRKYLDKQ